MARMAVSKSSVATARVASTLAPSIGFRQGLFLRQLVKRRIRCTSVFAFVLLLLDADDVGRALIAGEQVLAILGVEEFPQRLDATDYEEKIVLPFKREHCINQIVSRALLTELDFQTVGEEREKRVETRTSLAFHTTIFFTHFLRKRSQPSSQTI